MREIPHDVDASDPKVTLATWDLISRNVQMIVSGLYSWSVEDQPTGEVQMGKLVVIFEIPSVAGRLDLHFPSEYPVYARCVCQYQRHADQRDDQHDTQRFLR